MKNREVLGIDVGASGIKGAPVDRKEGILVDERFRIPTPNPADPESIMREIGNLIKHFNWHGPVGIGFPTVVQNGVVKTASNIDDNWIGVPITKELTDRTNLPVYVLNDADAAGTAEMKYGAGKDNKGVVLLITVGSGLGTVIFTQKKLLPNQEWGHVYMNHGKTGEQYAADSVRKELDLSWEDWAKRFNEYLIYLEKLVNPDLVIIGGGVSKEKKFTKFEEHLTIEAPVVPAKLMNEAGIIGAAYAAGKAFKK
jgi:polyphosphate glucokinase